VILESIHKTELLPSTWKYVSTPAMRTLSELQTNLLSTYIVHKVNAHKLITFIEEAGYEALLVLIVEYKLNILKYDVSYSEISYISIYVYICRYVYIYVCIYVDIHIYIYIMYMTKPGVGLCYIFFNDADVT
jgi:hypothetical protein